jgi:hypothetical protein
MTATTNTTTPVMRLDQLTKRYGDHVAVDKLSVDVPPGVVAGFIGRNGAGKARRSTPPSPRDVSTARARRGEEFVSTAGFGCREDGRRGGPWHTRDIRRPQPATTSTATAITSRCSGGGSGGASC